MMNRLGIVIISLTSRRYGIGGGKVLAGPIIFIICTKVMKTVIGKVRKKGRIRKIEENILRPL